MNADELFGAYAADPRDPAHASLRASDADRERVHALLRDAYADGRLEREEYDDRAGRLLASRTLGDLPVLVADLVTATPTSRRAPAPTTWTQPPSAPSGSPSGPGSGSAQYPAPVPLRPLATAELSARAEAAYETQRRAALLGFLAPTLICWAIWTANSLGAGHPGWPWPLIVTAATCVPVLRVHLSRQAIVQAEVGRLQRRPQAAPGAES